MSVGILDPEGLQPNPFTGEAYSETYRELARLWSGYPVYERRHEVLQLLRDHRVLLVVSATGSGKSVLLPKLALHHLDYRGRVVITNPRVTSTVENAKFAALCMDVPLGSYVGYRYRGAPRRSAGPDSRLLFATDGTVLQQLRKDPSARAYDVVIVDEAHERSVQIDFLLLMLKEALAVNDGLRVVIMSATISTEAFARYFPGVAVLRVSTETNFPVTQHFLDKKTKDYVSAGVKVLRSLREPRGDVLFFVTSKREGARVCEALKKTPGIFCAVLASGQPAREQEMVLSPTRFREEDSSKRVKVVAATNVAESSVTIKGLYYVLDPGYQLHGSFDHRACCRVLAREFVSKAQALQRRGRVGRTGAGEVFNLYTEAEFRGFRDYPTVQVEDSDLSSFSLFLLQVAGDRASAEELYGRMMTPPAEDRVRESFRLLSFLGLLRGRRLTALGAEVAAMRSASVCTGVALVHAREHRCERTVALLLAVLQVLDGRPEALFRRPVPDGETELWEAYRVFRLFREQGGADEAYVSLETLRAIAKEWRRLKRFLRGLPPPQTRFFGAQRGGAPLRQRVKRSLAVGFRCNIAVRAEEGGHRYTTTYPTKPTRAPAKATSAYIWYYELANILGKVKFNLAVPVPDDWAAELLQLPAPAPDASEEDYLG